MADASRDEQEKTWDEFKKLVNMEPQEIEDFLQTENSKKVGYKENEGDESVGHESGGRIVEIKRTNKADLSDDQYDHMNKVVGYIKRHCAQGGPDEDMETSDWRYSLMNWGHDPMKADGCG